VKTKIKEFLKYFTSITSPTRRRSRLVIRYLRLGYNAQEALAKVGVIEG